MEEIIQPALAVVRGGIPSGSSNSNEQKNDDEKVPPVSNEEILSSITTKINEDIQKISSTMQSDKSAAPKSSLFRSTIHKVPHNWRIVHEAAFKPKFVCIGPFHRYISSSRHDMQELKLRFLSDLLSSKTTSAATRVANNNSPVERLASEIKELEAEIRSCYSMTFDNIDSEEFVLMMIRDGCFVVQLLRLVANCYEVADNPIFSMCWLVPNLRRDLLLFENQLPWIVLEIVFKISGLDQEGHSLIGLALKFCNPQNTILHKCKSDRKPDHLLGLFHTSFLSRCENEELEAQTKEGIKSASFCSSILSHFRNHQESGKSRKSHSSLQHKADEKQPQLELKISEFILEQGFEKGPLFIPCVAELQEMGVKFKKRGNHDLLDIAFKNRVLEIPPLLIDDQTVPLFLNFLAYEQCPGILKPYFTHYASFIDYMVKSAKDVEILHYNGIIRHSLGSHEEVAELFKEIVHVVDGTNYLYEVMKEINKYCNRMWSGQRAKLSHIVQFSVISAIFLLTLNILQTVFTILPAVSST